MEPAAKVAKMANNDPTALPTGELKVAIASTKGEARPCKRTQKHALTQSHNRAHTYLHTHACCCVNVISQPTLLTPLLPCTHYCHLHSSNSFPVPLPLYRLRCHGRCAAALGSLAATLGAQQIVEALASKGHASIILATGASQFEVRTPCVRMPLPPRSRWRQA